jgi:Flp pilus assembly protein TadB
MANSKASFSIPSLIALVAAILIFVVGNGFLVFVLAGVAIIFGLIVSKRARRHCQLSRHRRRFDWRHHGDGEVAAGDFLIS